MPEIKQDIRTATIVVASNGSLNKNMADYVCDGVADDVEVQLALDALPAAGGTINLLDGPFTFAAQVLRALDNVTIKGQGLSTRITLDGVTPVFTAGAQDGWTLSDFDVDAGLVDIAGATNSTLHNITINGLHSTIINPDTGVTRFPGQPVIRTEEIRTLTPGNPIKVYDKHEYQDFNPTFATPEFIMEMLERQARVPTVPITGEWADGSTVGSVTVYPQYMLLNTGGAVANQDGLAFCVAAFVNSSFGAGAYNLVDWDNKLIIAFDIARTVGDNAALRGRVQLKQANAEGILAALGLGIEIQNLDIYGETYGGARSTVSLATTMTLDYTYRIMLVFTPGVGCDFYVNNQYTAQLTTVANLPSGLAGATSYWVCSIDNQAVAVDGSMVVGPIKFWNRL